MQHEYVYPIVRPLPSRMSDVAIQPIGPPQIAITSAVEGPSRRHNALRMVGASSVRSIDRSSSAQIV